VNDTRHTATEQLIQPTERVLGCRVVVLDGPDKDAQYDLREGAVVLGSSSDAGLKLSDSAVSGEHVRIAATSDGIVVTDLGSTNGTRYLGTNIKEAVVNLGAVLTIGRTRVAIASPEPPAGVGYSPRTSYGELRGASPAMRAMYGLLEQLEGTEYTVLIQGETGSGKELVAREIHARSSRSNGPFEVMNCGAVPSQLAQSEFFGHRRGAFSGAIADHDGIFSRGHRGTVFLDEIGELPLDMQPMLLRTLESGEFRPIGADETEVADTRVVAATNKVLADEVKRGTFREDLFFRLNVVTVRAPPLRERREDIPELIRHFLEQAGQGEVEIASETLQLFICGYHWPGNVRELRHALQATLSLGAPPPQVAGKPGSVEALASQIDTSQIDTDAPFSEERKRLLDAFEHDYLSTQLKRANNNLAEAARLSGIDRSYLKRILKRHGLR